MQNSKNKNESRADLKLHDIDLKIVQLAKNPSFLSAQDLIVELASLLGIQTPEKSKFSFILDQKFIKNEPWFLWHEIFPDKRAGEVLKHTENIPLEIKVYWVNKIASDRIKGIVRFVDNFEDNKRTRADQKTLVGIDFIINPKADGVTIALSNNGSVRVLEIKNKLNNTQKKILSSWLEIASGEMRFEREYLHQSLWNSFELKVVNQQFYDMISSAFTDLKQHLESKKVFSSDSAKQFSNRLIGRILFVWFLRKKDFISDEKISYFKTSDLDDEVYYKTRLERLFFETLNKPIELRDALHDDLKTPYLNGGLFYRQENDTPKEEFSFPKGFFANLYKNLDEYNFTTDESTPDFEQVAIDPEMLGRVFENLLASMTTETGEQARKAKGAFYTPREIVQYMCRESVRQFLYSSLDKTEYRADIDRLIDTPDYEWANNESNKVRDISKKGGFGDKVIDILKDMKSIDPACGSGAFPIGMLQTLLRMYTRLNRTINEYEIKLRILENNIFGVDIEPMAVEISRLRAFLALVVDQEYSENNKNGGIDTLPNLEFKFVCANSLLKLDKDSGLYDGLPTKGKKKQTNLQDELIAIKKKYFKANWKDKKKLEEELDQKLSSAGLFESKKYEQLRSYHPIRQISPATFYDPMLMHDVTTGFDVVIGNPPYVSTKGVDLKSKKDLDANFGFADDLYSHFYFKGLELCKDQGVLSYITSKTFWTIQTKKNVRELLLKNNFVDIYDTANPFESVMVDTCVVLVQKNSNQLEKINFLIGNEIVLSNGKKEVDYLNPIKQQVDKIIYEKAVNKVIFNPSPENLTIYHKYNDAVSDLMKKWWLMISTSKNITKNGSQLIEYRDGLKAGDITLLGLITDGGQGLATGSNGKYVGVLSTTKEAMKTKEARVNKFFEFITDKKITEYGSSKESVRVFLNKKSEQEIRELFDSLKEKYGRDIFGTGFLYRIVDPSEIKDVNLMSDKDKKGGLSGNQTFVPYDKGDKDGNRWYLRTPYYIDWSMENIDWLKQDTKARFQGYQFYFRAGFCWINVLNPNARLIKTRLKEKSVNDVGSMSLYSFSDKISDKFCVCLLNSNLLFDYYRTFINFTVNVQINDLRQLPVIIPSKEQLADFEDLFDHAYAIKVSQFDGKITNAIADQKLQEIQKELDEKVLRLYGLFK